MKNPIANIFKNFVIYLLLCLATFLMLKTISLYFSFDDKVAFLSQKQDYIDNTIWKISFYVHVFSSIFVLLAGFTQFSNYILANHKKIHRWLGRFYAYNIFLINFPAGMIMAIYANGFLPSKMAFIILDCLWFWFTLKAVIEIRRKNVKEHKNYMIRSYALTCSAITLRTWKLILSNLFTIDPMTLYMIDAWLGFVPNLLFAEWLIKRKKK
ncbi:MAG: DUF2306 domain-containing protein [Bacteroidetes bacterium]|nr:DUF2306 domain-containing protein [Bacteroidota bacterium]